MPDRAPAMSVAEVTAFLAAEFPQILDGEAPIRVESVGPMQARVRLPFHTRHLRPGGTLSGPAMFMLADVSLYIAILAQIGPVALAVTTNLTINFLRRPSQVDLVADCRLLKLGRRLAVGEVALRSHGRDDIIAHATGTYSLPDHKVL